MKRLLAAIIAILVPVAGQAAGRPVTFEDIVGLKRASEPRMAPDGSQVVFVVSEWDRGEDSHNKDLYWVSASGGDPLRLTYHPKEDRHPRWSPKGDAIAFLSDREEKTQIYAFSIPGGEPRKLTSHGESVGSFEWSPDGKAILFLAPEASKEEEAAKEEQKEEGKEKKKTKKIVVVDEDHRYAHIWRLDLSTEKITQVSKGEFHVAEATFSPDGRSIAYVAQATPKVADSLSRELYLIPAEGGEPRRLTSNGYSESSPRWSPDGSRLAYLSEADGNPVAGPSRIHILPASGGEPLVLARRFDGYIQDFYWSKDGKTLIFSADLKVNRHLFTVSASDGEPEPLTSGDGLFGPFSMDGEGRSVAFLHESPERPADVWWKSGLGEPGRPLTRLNPQAEEWALAKVEIIRWKSADGMEIEGLVVYPLDYQPGRRYPTILEVHGGPEGAYMRGFMASHGNFPHVYAAAGYVTLLPNFRGSSNYGAKFAQANRADVGGGDFQDCMSGIDHLIAKGVADPNRLAIKGWSYGGYMSGWAVGHTTRFRAAAYGAGLSNAVSYYGTADIQASRENLHGGTPYTNRANWDQRSPLSFVANVKTPCLIFHGEKDERVPLTQSQEFYMGLRKQNVPAKLVVYPDQPHGLRVPSYQLDKMKREFEWIEKYLKAPEATGAPSPGPPPR